MLKIAVMGAGHLGKIHLRLLQELPEYELVGFYDPDDQNALEAAEKFGVKRFEDWQELIDQVTVVDIVTPTVSHFSCASLAVEKGKHIFIEKPLTNTLSEAALLIDMVAEKGVKAQVGHVERFNPAYLSIQNQKIKPVFVESHRLAQFNPRGTDVSVVFDLMIHDLDILLNLIQSPVSEIRASGVGIVSNSIDIANARIAFVNGCVANVTASRLSLKNMRKMRVFQPDAYLTIDFLEKKSQIFQLTDQPMDHFSMEIDKGDQSSNQYITLQEPAVPDVNAIQMELALLAKSILEDTPTAVPLEDGYAVMDLATKIMQQIEANIRLTLV